MSVKLKTKTAKSVDPDETAHDEPSHLDLHCLQRDVLVYKVERVKLPAVVSNDPSKAVPLMQYVLSTSRVLTYSHLCLAFVRFVLVWICRFPLPLGVLEGCGL